MTADELAAQLKLSGKTVRSLIKTYAKEMQENGFCITAKPGRGFGIEITDAQTYVSGSKPQQGEQTGIPQDAQERIQRLRQYLLEKDGYSKLDDLSLSLIHILKHHSSKRITFTVLDACYDEDAESRLLICTAFRAVGTLYHEFSI